MHRIVMDVTDGRQIDHINGDPLDNRKCNLRFVTNQENGRNRGAQVNNKSGYKGVSWHPKAKKWEACIRAGESDGRRAKKIYLGVFASKHDAARAYNVAACKYHGEHAYLNIIQEDTNEERLEHSTNITA